jgi:hypothetical protein
MFGAWPTGLMKSIRGNTKCAMGENPVAHSQIE